MEINLFVSFILSVLVINLYYATREKLAALRLELDALRKAHERLPCAIKNDEESDSEKKEFLDGIKDMLKEKIMGSIKSEPTGNFFNRRSSIEVDMDDIKKFEEVVRVLPEEMLQELLTKLSTAEKYEQAGIISDELKRRAEV